MQKKKVKKNEVRFVQRMPVELHRKTAKVAAAKFQSLNGFINNEIEKAVQIATELQK